MDEQPQTSIADVIGGMEPGELLVLADALRALRDSDGWQALGRLLDIEEARLDRLAVSRRRMLAGSLDELVHNGTVAAHEAGVVAGLRKPSSIIVDVIDTAERVERVINERED